jgi:hypothetical protein
MRIEFARPSGPDWHVQLNWPGLEPKEGRYYTFSFRARSDKPRKTTASVSLDPTPWMGLGLQRTLELTNEWETHKAGGTATPSPQNVKIIQAGDQDLPILPRQGCWIFPSRGTALEDPASLKGNQNRVLYFGGLTHVSLGEPGPVIAGWTASARGDAVSWISNVSA